VYNYVCIYIYVDRYRTVDLFTCNFRCTVYLCLNNSWVAQPHRVHIGKSAIPWLDQAPLDVSSLASTQKTRSKCFQETIGVLYVLVPWKHGFIQHIQFEWNPMNSKLLSYYILPLNPYLCCQKPYRTRTANFRPTPPLFRSGTAGLRGHRRWGDAFGLGKRGSKVKHAVFVGWDVDFESPKSRVR
jgi:hypothetical protein